MTIVRPLPPRWRLGLAVVVLAGTAGLQGAGPPCGDYDVAAHVSLRFKKGERSATVESGVMARFRDLYDLRARKGQKLTVRISSPSDNAVFQICRPDRKRTLEGASFGEDATAWSGILPATGTYTIIVGPSRQSAEYKLSVKIE